MQDITVEFVNEDVHVYSNVEDHSVQEGFLFITVEEDERAVGINMSRINKFEVVIKESK